MTIFFLLFVIYLFVLGNSDTRSNGSSEGSYKEPIPLQGVKWPVHKAERTFFDLSPQAANKVDIFVEAEKDVPLSRLVQLSIFGSIRPGVTFEEAITRYGKPTRTRKEEYSRIAVYEHADVRIEVEDFEQPTSVFFTNYRRKSVYAYFKPPNRCVEVRKIMDPSVTIFIPEKGRTELHIAERAEDGDSAFVTVIDRCVKVVNWFALDEEGKKATREILKEYPD